MIQFIVHKDQHFAYNLAMKYLISFIFAFFMGAVPYAYIVGRVTKHIDIRKYGTKNPGAGNVFHLISWRAGTVALIGDAGKGFLALYIIWLVYKFNGTILTYLGIASVLGHVFSPFLEFKGGKGAATSGGFLLFVIPVTLKTKAITFLTYYIIAWLILLLITHSQVVTLSVIMPTLPISLWFVTGDINLVIAIILLVILIEALGAGSLRREWQASYEKYISRYFKQKNKN
jgi:glycerol-3-phosphate acyltransferase PlsY